MQTTLIILKQASQSILNLILGNHTIKIIANYYFGYNLICTNIKSNIKGFNIKSFF